MTELQQQYYYIINYGCQMNESDSEHFAGQLSAIGYINTDDIALADIILINTCCVRESAEKKIYGKIGELKRLKTANPNLIICITGCMAQKEGDKLLKKAPHIDLILGTHNIDQLTDFVNSIKQSPHRVVAIDEKANNKMVYSTDAVRKSAISAWVPIMYGCNNFCTYCIVPYVRGRERSRPTEDIINEVTQLGQAGYKEITLLGQNVNSYGKDQQGIASFAELLKLVDNIKGIERIRFMTSHPRDISEDVINNIANGNKLCEHIHLPIQSGSDEILKQMNRGYITEYYLKLVSKIRQAIPNVSLTTDLIVGFPGETDEHFEQTMELLKTVRFDAAYTFLYSKRSGTPAAKMMNQIDLSVKKARLQKLMQVQNDISLEINKTLVGQTLEVLVEGTSKNDNTKFTGRTRTNKIVIWEKTDNVHVGDLVNVHITNAQTWLLKGREQA